MVLYIPGNAKASDVTEGVKYSAGTTVNGTGTLKDFRNQGQKTGTVISPEEGYISVGVPETGVYRAENTEALLVYDTNFIPSNILQGKPIFGMDGTIGDLRGKEVTFGGFGQSGTSILLAQPSAKGVYDDLTNFSVSDPDFIDSNIKSGVSLFGKTGTYAGASPFKKLTLTSSSTPMNVPNQIGGNENDTYVIIDMVALGFRPKIITSKFSLDVNYACSIVWSDLGIYANFPNGGYANYIRASNPAGTSAYKSEMLRVPYELTSTFKFPVGRANQEYELLIYG
ncbi:hypothetical protein [Paenibacillus pseudetheri]|uniref:Uncharacterized protein n=1 Tax=Paenibacillus pseudetheri TaxID=2897682 RepID=A0ABM9BIL6_9BACL|nr:hypothetical protein [Paenibacillus pseudetheri]CAH1058840.1 hypothetical protein PAECIP111894_05026 [Paenibacillus pseudetheri]